MGRFYKVFAIGFNATERILLGSIFSLSTRRNPSYRPAEPGEEPDLLLVDGAHPVFVEEALSTVARQPAAVLLVAGGDLDTGWHWVARPLHWARLFKAMDLSLGFLTHGIAARQIGARLAPTGHELADDLAEGDPVRGQDRRVPESERHHGARQRPPAVPAAANRILYVAARASASDPVLMAIASIGAHVDVAERGETALEMIGERAYACLFVDVTLPGIDGYRVCRAVKSRRAGAGPPVVLLKSKASAFERIRASMAGCDAFLATSASGDEFRAVAARLMPGSGRAELAKVAPSV